jgi:NADH-quinone oxidoreductase subunit A
MFYEYILLLSYFIISFGLGLIIYLCSYFGIERYIDVEKMSIYECGFAPFVDTREQVNIKYYIISILFIIFDIELLFLFPWVFIIYYLNFFGFMIMFLFLYSLILIYIYEWLLGIFEW